MDGGLVIGGKNQSLMREVTELENALSKARLKYLEESKVVKVFKDRLEASSNIVLISLIPIPNNSSFLLLRLLRVFLKKRMII